MSTCDLRIQNLLINAGGRDILEVRDLAIQQGELVGIVGPNGAGKSTLLKAALGWRRRTRGEVELLGTSLARIRGWELTRLRRDVGYIPQERAAHSFLPLTVREVVAIGRTGRAGLLRPLRRGDWETVDAWLERLGLAALRGQTYATLSGGEQRKVLIARAMVQQPRMLVLDEPTAHLDLGWREQIVTTLDELSRAGDLTIVLVCHELEVLPAGCRRVILLEEGRVVADGPPADVLTTDRVQRLYGSGLDVQHTGGRHMVVPVAKESA